MCQNPVISGNVFTNKLEIQYYMSKGGILIRLLRLQLIIVLCLYILVPQIAFADDTNPGGELLGKFTVNIDNHVNVFVQPAILGNGEVYFPLRSLLEAFGAKIGWNQETSSTIIEADEKEYLLELDLTKSLAKVDEDSAFPVRILNSRTYLPLSLLKEILNYDLYWDNQNHTLHAVRVPAAATVFEVLPEAPEFKVVDTFSGVASWYGGEFHGRKTNSGEIFDENGLTAAHRTLPFNTYLRVTFLKTDKSVVVRVNDRGPHVAGRVLDLSRGAAEAIGLRAHGLGTVKVEVLENYRTDA